VPLAKVCRHSARKRFRLFVSVQFGIITSVVPPGGWTFPQLLSSGQTVKITGFSFEQLLDSMLEFRRRHLDLCGGATKATIEWVRRDLKEYYCRNFRQNCADAPASPNIQSGGIGLTNYVTPINKAADWLAGLADQGVERVDPAMAAHRGQICAQCSFNVRWQTPCQPCNDNVSVRTQNAKGSLSTPYDRNLMVCRIYGHMNEVAVWLSDTRSVAQSHPPPHCWVPKKEGG
jgi:hypothetical protein